MAVTFDAVGTPASQIGQTTSPITWTHTCGAGATELLVAVSVNSGGDSGLTATATYNSVSMTSVLRWQSGGATQSVGFLQVFSLPSPPTGSAYTVSVTVSGSGLTYLNGGSLSFLGSATIGSAVHNDSNSTSVTTATTGNVATTSVSNIVAAFMCDGSLGITSTAGTSRWIDTSGSGSGAAQGCAGATIAGTGGNVVVTWTQASDYFATIAIEVQAPSSIALLVDSPVPVNMPVIVTGRAGWRNAGHSR